MAGEERITRTYIIVLEIPEAVKFAKILKDEKMTADQWLANIVNDYET